MARNGAFSADFMANKFQIPLAGEKLARVKPSRWFGRDTDVKNKIDRTVVQYRPLSSSTVWRHYIDLLFKV